MSATYLTLMVLYGALMIAVALWFSRAAVMKDGEDFVLAGKSLPAPVLAGTMLATFVGSGSIIGGANFVYSYGPIPGIIFFLGTFVGILCLLALAPKVRANGFRTVPELFQARFGRATRVVGTAMVLLAFVGITAYQFTGAGNILSLILPVSAAQGTVIAAVLITVLTLGGGLKSVAWTDFYSAALIVLGLLVCLVYVFTQDVGGVGSYVDRLDPALRTFTGSLGPVQMLGYFLPLFLLILGDQNMHQRLAAAKDGGTATKATIMFFVGAIFIIGPIILLASSSSFLLPGIEPDMAILGLAGAETTPELIGGIVLVAALALIITTGSSYLLTCSGNFVYDLIFVNQPERANQRAGVMVGRTSVLAIAVFAYIMVQFFPSVLELQMYAYTMYGAALTPVILAALFWKRATAAGAIATILVGGAVTVFWEATGRSADVNSVIISLPAAIVTLVVVSLLTPARARPVEATAAADQR
ncbi:sodium:solute symporter family protein [Aeromicrobium camelliae]|uniref:Sodium:solute symporter family protein n=1 Tax=Aeromicrobium camelliae TaxID=1538144 RepID=A0A3N6WNV7_9ACTN|nr:sodium:solute symporter family protein [Aeromicrobium camelliae]RQN03033.1 sodium:solute symporter family protein [Aeromicrobium camelliae]